MPAQSPTIVQCVWNYYNLLRNDGISYGDYVRQQLAEMQEVESVVAASVARASRLRQSVLKHAFEGKLQ